MLRITLALTLALVAFASASTEEGKAWLAEKAAEEGVVTLASGLQYKVRCISSLLSLPCKKHTWKISLQKSRGGEREREGGSDIADGRQGTVAAPAAARNASSIMVNSLPFVCCTLRNS